MSEDPTYSVTYTETDTGNSFEAVVEADTPCDAADTMADMVSGTDITVDSVTEINPE